MPKMNQTGPRGQGPLTGRGMGNCEGANGFSRCGRACGQRAVLTKEEQLQVLAEKEALMLQSLEEIKKAKKLLSDKK